MTVQFDSLNSNVMRASLPTDRKNSDSRHHAWLLELERAMLADGTKKGMNSTTTDDVPLQENTASISELPSSEQSQSLNKNGAFVASTPDHFTNAHSESRGIEHSAPQMEGQMNKDVSSTSSSRIDSVKNSNSESESFGDLSFSASSNPALSPAVSMKLDVPTSMISTSNLNISSIPINEGIVLSNSVLFSAPKLSIDVAYQNQFLHMVNTNVLSSAVKPSALTEWKQPFSPETKNAHTSEEILHLNDQKTTNSAAKSSEDHFLLRQLHLYKGNGEVQAWIRDSDLNESSTDSVAQALSNELSKSGDVLTALTLNGKKVSSTFISKQKNDDPKNFILNEVIESSDDSLDPPQFDNKYL